MTNVFEGVRIVELAQWVFVPSSVALLADLGATYPAGTTFDDDVVRDFRVVGMPTTFFIRADGSLLRSWSGLLTESKFNEIIDELVAG